MEVILRKNVERIGRAGEVVNVKEGFARNYLFPKKLAVENNEKNKKLLENEQKVIKQKETREKNVSENTARRLENISCTINVKVGAEEKLFGSVTSADIAESLKAQGLEIDKKHIVLDEPIKELGVFVVDVKLGAGVTGKVKVWVVKE